MRNRNRNWCSWWLMALVIAALPLALAAPVFAQDGDGDNTADPQPDDGMGDSGDPGDSDPGDPGFTDPAGDPSTGDSGADVDSPPAEGADPDAEPEPEGEPAEGEGEDEETDKQKRQRHLRTSGWTLNHALPRTHAAVWLTHWNDDFERFIHDLHVLFEYAFNLDDEMVLSGWTEIGFRFQGAAVPTGFDNMWLGAKLALAAGKKSTFSFGLALGLPTGKRQSGSSAIFTDSANGQLVGFDDFAIDFAFFYTLTTKDFGLNIDLHLNVPIGLRTEFAFQGGAEAVIPLGDSFDVRGGFMFSTAFTPFTIYAEAGFLLGDDMTISGRVQLPFGSGDNFGNVADLVIFAIFDFRFHFGDE